MKRLLVLTSVLLLVHLTAAAPALPTISEQGRAALSAFLRGAIARGDVPGIVALVVNPERVLYQEAVGKLDMARNRNMTGDAIFRIASMTKPVTSVAVLMLAEEGKLGLDDQVSNYLPSFKAPQVITRFNEVDATYDSRDRKSVV